MGLWCVVGGGGGGGGRFNVVKTPSECSKGGQISSSMRRFLAVIEDLGLRVCLAGGPFHEERRP